MSTTPPSAPYGDAPSSHLPPPPPPGRPGGPPGAYPPPWWLHPPRRSSVAGRIFLTLGVLIFILSIIMNLYLLTALGIRFEQSFDRETIQAGSEKEVIAVYAIAGIIDGGQAERMASFYKEVADSKAVKAVVLRVESPGGGVTASDEMYDMVKKLKEKGKKVVVSMGGVAASGGYYVSAPADYIVAEPTTVTGSIGVMAGWMVLKGTLDKIGVEPIVMRSTAAQDWKDEMSLFRKPNDVQAAHIQHVLDQLQTRFSDVVTQGRAGKLKTHTIVHKPAAGGEGAATRPAEYTETEPLNGKIYLADEALKLGLVDSIGYFDAAVDQAKTLAGLSNPCVVRYQYRLGFFQALMRGQDSGEARLDLRVLDKLQTPQIMMMWKAE